MIRGLKHFKAFNDNMLHFLFFYLNSNILFNLFQKMLSLFVFLFPLVLGEQFLFFNERDFERELPQCGRKEVLKCQRVRENYCKINSCNLLGKKPWSSGSGRWLMT